MKEPKTQQAPLEGDWVDRVRQLLSVPKAEIDRREAAWKKQKQKRARQRARAVIVLVGLACSVLHGCATKLAPHSVACDLLLPVCVYQHAETTGQAFYRPILGILLWPLALTVGVLVDGVMKNSPASAQDAANQTIADSIIVTPSDLSRPYTVLGSVDYPGKGVTQISLTGSPQTCAPDNARRKAVEEYGSRVSAIIGFTQWRDGSTAHCGGTAVAFSDGH